MTREEAMKKLKGAINLLVEVCHFATDSILCEELEDVIEYLEIDLNNAEKLHKPTKYEPLYYAKIKGWELIENSKAMYWNYYEKADAVFISNSENTDKFKAILTKAEWAKLGITDKNADFEEVEE